MSNSTPTNTQHSARQKPATAKPRNRSARANSRTRRTTTQPAQPQHAIRRANHAKIPTNVATRTKRRKKLQATAPANQQQKSFRDGIRRKAKSARRKSAELKRKARQQLLTPFRATGKSPASSARCKATRKLHSRKVRVIKRNRVLENAPRKLRNVCLSGVCCNWLAACALRVGNRNGRQKFARVILLRVVEDLRAVAQFDDFAALHHGDSVA